LHNLMGAHDESLRCRAYVIEGKAGYERQCVLAGWLQDLSIAGQHYLGPIHLIIVLSAERLNRDRIARSNVAQWTKEAVAMGCQDHVALFARQSRLGDMADGVPQDSWRISLDEDGVEPETRDLHLSDSTSLDQRMRSFTLAQTLEFRLFHCLIRVRVGDDVARVTEREDAGAQEKVERPLNRERSGSPLLFSRPAARIHDAFFPCTAEAGASYEPIYPGRDRT